MWPTAAVTREGDGASPRAGCGVRGRRRTVPRSGGGTVRSGLLGEDHPDTLVRERPLQCWKRLEELRGGPHGGPGAGFDLGRETPSSSSGSMRNSHEPLAASMISDPVQAASSADGDGIKSLLTTHLVLHSARRCSTGRSRWSPTSATPLGSLKRAGRGSPAVVAWEARRGKGPQRRHSS